MLNWMVAGKTIWEEYTKDEITVYAAQASFFIVISFFPFLMLLLTLVQFIPAVSKSDVLTILVATMPDMLDSLVVSIVDDLFVKSPATILSVTGILALWSASKGMMGIERGLNRIHGTQEKRNYFVRRIVCAGYTVIFMLVCIASLVLLVFGTGIQQFLTRLFPVLASMARHVINFRSLLSTALFLVSFIGLYTIVPKKKQNPWQQIPGALFSTIGWMVFSYAFSFYFTHFSNYSYMYGSLTAIVLFMLWLYFGICIIFIGAEINHYVYDSSM